MNDSLLMLSSFIKRPKEIGALVPSSKFLTKEIVKGIDRKSKIIVELGPGLGTFTKQILEKPDKKARLFCFEINKKFCSYLNSNINDKRLVVLNAGAEKMSAALRKFGIEKADCIVSGLPFRNFPETKRNKILGEVAKSLKEGGRFILFQYTNGLNGILNSHFSKVTRKFVPLNVPPAFVYICEM